MGDNAGGREHEGKGKIESIRNRGWTLFMNNLSNQIHWKGLWQVFDRHGHVLDVFIPTKKSRMGARFGFVRMKSKMEAQRVRDRLNGA
ncbi:hypothetical protein HRI_001518400 [Hibiscus trionum]|uniref:RRM domain-containing protein n=1 Tax=Hibiscus trionum TaxID=183268 RepID=A0A9W7HJV3_HIBTR|nr:hypothetical protein HRI_001518400 [Hibiscus trionum]